MRMFIRIRPDLRAANSAIAEGSMRGALQRAHEQLKPEASYFLPQDGHRTAIFICDVPDESHLVSMVEPFFSNLEAEIDVQPVMNFDDLCTGLDRLAQS